MERIVYKQTIKGADWEKKIDNFAAHMKSTYGETDKELIRELANNIMVRDLILDCEFKMTEDQKFELFKKYNDIIVKLEKEKLKKKK